MNRRKRKKAGHASLQTSMQCSEKIPTDAVPAESLLFHPVISRSGGWDRHIDFENINIPFQIRDNIMFQLLFISGCGDNSVYLKAVKLNPDRLIHEHQDAIPLMKACLEMEQLTGVTYYFGHLQSAVKQYLYALQLFTACKILTKEQAISLAETLGYDTEEMKQASETVSQDMEQTRIKRAEMRRKAEVQTTAAGLMLDFLNSMKETEDENDPM